jgi:hypothetical protein
MTKRFFLNDKTNDKSHGKKYPLSIFGFFMLLLLVSACKTSTIMPYDTTIAVKSDRLSPVDLTEKRVLVVSYDSELTREFLISLKNYVSEELKTHKIKAERLNIRYDEPDDVAELAKVKTTFTPDYLLTVKVSNERTRKFYMIGKNVKKLRGINLTLNLLPNQQNTEGASVWKSDVEVNHFYDTEYVAAAKKLAKELGVKMQKDLIIK